MSQPRQFLKRRSVRLRHRRGGQAGKARVQAGRFLGLGALLLLLLALLGGRTLWILRSHVKTDDAFVDGDVVPISSKVPGHVAQVFVLENQWVEQGTLLLQIDSTDYQAALRREAAAVQAAKAKLRAAQFAAQLETVSAKAFLQRTTSTLDEARAAVQRLSAELEAAKKELQQAKNALQEARSAIAAQEAVVRSAKAQAELQKRQRQRLKRLYQAGGLSKEELDRAKTAAVTSWEDFQQALEKKRAAQAELAQRRAQQQTLQKVVEAKASAVTQAQAKVAQVQATFHEAATVPQKIEKIGAEVAVAQAELKEAKEALREDKLKLSYTKIYAPTSGWVTKKQVEAGEYVQPGEFLLSLVPARVWVVANFKETQIQKLAVGARAAIEVDAYRGKKFAGRVESLQAGSGSRFSLFPPENATGNFVKVVQRIPVRIVFLRPVDFQRYHIVPGMSAVVEVAVTAQPKP